jgi:hypothetical protein
MQKYDFVGARINLEKGSKHEGLVRLLIRQALFRVIVNPLISILGGIYLKLKGYNCIEPIDSIKGVER